MLEPNQIIRQIIWADMIKSSSASLNRSNDSTQVLHQQHHLASQRSFDNIPWGTSGGTSMHVSMRENFTAIQKLNGLFSGIIYCFQIDILV